MDNPAVLPRSVAASAAQGNPRDLPRVTVDEEDLSPAGERPVP
jgi:hypothetical protein